MTELHPPRVQPVGLSGLLLTYADKLDLVANQRALRLRRLVDQASHPAIRETATSLTSTFIDYDPLAIDQNDLIDWMLGLDARHNTHSLPSLKSTRRRWHIPVEFGGEAGPELLSVAADISRSPQGLVGDLTSAELSVMTIGFMPGFPYIGMLPPNWNIPRLSELTPKVDAGAICVALRQLVIFPKPSATGWRQVGRTSFRSFDPTADNPFPLSAGDEIRLFDITRSQRTDAWCEDIGT